MKTKRKRKIKPPLAKFDLKLVRSCCERHRLKPDWKSLNHLLDCLDKDGPAHRATALAIRQALWKDEYMTLSCFIRPAIKKLFGEEL